MKNLEKAELLYINGGASTLSKWFKGGIWISAAKFVYDHWTEIKTGAIDGWNDGGKDL